MQGALLRRERAVARGLFVDKSPVPMTALMVPRELASDMRCILRGKIIHVARAAANGEGSFSTQLTVLKSFASGGSCLTSNV